MFPKARFRLTTWYLLIIMGVSFIFSFIIYTGINTEFKKIERAQRMFRERIEENFPPGYIPPPGVKMKLDSGMVTEARIKLLTILGTINAVIFIVAGAAGYFLAGRTLRPIEKMVDEQDRFITDASHELRTPLTSLRSEIEVGLRNKKMTLSESKELLKSNLEEVISLQSLSDNLLELAQQEKLNNTNNCVNISISESIETAIKKLNGMVKKKQIFIEKDIEDVPIQGIPDRIVELFTILIDNAIKYSPKKSTVSISSSKRKDIVEIKIEDQGVGIAREDIPHIFDRFYRANKSRSKERIDGFGLGLSIAKKIVTSHGGTIFVKSKVEQGTTFIIHLPTK